jgi:lysyl-tRNA synthetase class 2
MTNISARPPWWSRERHGDRRHFLVARGAIRDAIRSYFRREDFIEVECGALQVSPGNETHINAFETAYVDAAGRMPRYLHTSPEFASKKLLAAGERRIFDFARVFRNGEMGDLHAPEFTMLEWYRADAPYADVIADTLTIVRMAARVAGTRTMTFRGASCDVEADADWLTLTEAFDRYAGIDLPSALGSGDRLGQAARSIGVRVSSTDGWSDIFSRVLVERIEPHLGKGRLTVLHRYPLEEAALARPCADDARFCERFELYACGVELANGFGELTDAQEQRRRFEAAMAERSRIYGGSYPVDEAFLSALATMPDASGVALGYDRLVMLATGARSVSEVIWTPFE